MARRREKQMQRPGRPPPPPAPCARRGQERGRGCRRKTLLGRAGALAVPRGRTHKKKLVTPKKHDHDDGQTTPGGLAPRVAAAARGGSPPGSKAHGGRTGPNAQAQNADATSSPSAVFLSDPEGRGAPRRRRRGAAARRPRAGVARPPPFPCGHTRPTPPGKERKGPSDCYGALLVHERKRERGMGKRVHRVKGGERGDRQSLGGAGGPPAQKQWDER